MKKYDFKLIKNLSKEIINCDTVNEVIELKRNKQKEFDEYFNIIDNETERLDGFEFSYIIAVFVSLISMLIQFTYKFDIAFPIFTRESSQCTLKIVLISIVIGLMSTMIAYLFIWKNINKRNFRKYLIIRKYLNEISVHLNEITIKELLDPKEYEDYFDLCINIEDAKNIIQHIIKTQ